MSVQTNTSVQLTTPPINANTTPSQFLDQAIALETLKIMDKTINNGRWTWAVVGTVFFILSLDGMKRVIINLVDKSITYLCNMTGEQWSNVGSTIISPVKLIGKGISLPFRYTYKKFNPEVKVKEPIPYQTYPLECSESLWKMLHLRPEFSFDSEIMSIKYVGNGNEMEQTEKWRNMKIETSSFIVYFEGNINIKFTIKSTTSGSTIKLFTKSEITSSRKAILREMVESSPIRAMVLIIVASDI